MNIENKSPRGKKKRKGSCCFLEKCAWRYELFRLVVRGKRNLDKHLTRIGHSGILVKLKMNGHSISVHVVAGSEAGCNFINHILLLEGVDIYPGRVSFFVKLF